MVKQSIYTQISANKRNSYLLFIFFFAIMFVLGWIVSEVFGYGTIGLVLICSISIIWVIISYYAGDKMVLAANRCREVSKRDEPYLVNTVECLALAAGIPTPKIYIVEDPAPNAFATGRDPEHSSVAVTRGLLNSLNRAELEGVIAHEISHIKNYDIRYMTLVIVVVGIIGMIASIISYTFIFSNNRNSNNRGLIIVGILAAILAPIFAQIVQLAISRQREYLADSSGALLTHNPQGLADALKKIASDKTPSRSADKTSASLYIANPFKKVDVAGLFSTHPPIKARIAKLEKM